MKVNIEKIEDLFILDLAYNKDEFDGEMLSVARSIRPKAKLKGFRQGKAPLDVVLKNYSEAIRGEVTTSLLYKGIESALREPKLKGAGSPTLLEDFRPTKQKNFVGKINLHGELKFKVSVEAPPVVDISNYKGISIAMEDSNCSEWVEEELRKQQELFGDTVVLDRPVKSGDEINISVDGSVDGSTVLKEDDFTFKIGEGVLVKELEDAFIGKSSGDEFEVDVVFPPDYQDKNLASKSVKFKAKLFEGVEVVPHELNDELAKLLSYSDLNDMREKFSEKWGEEFRDKIRAQKIGLIMDSIIESNQFNVPKSWVDQELKIVAQRVGLKELPTDKNTLLTLRDISERSVKSSFILDKIYEKEGNSITLSAEELESLLSEAGREHNLSGEEYLLKIREHGDYDSFVSFYEQQKTIDFLIENSVVVGV